MVLTIQLYIVQSKHGWKVAQMFDEVRSATFIKCHEEWNWREQCEKTKAGTRLTSKLHTDKCRAEAFCQPLLSTPTKVTSQPLEHILVGRAGRKKVSRAASVCSGTTRVADDSMTMARRERCSANCLRTQKSVYPTGDGEHRGFGSEATYTLREIEERIFWFENNVFLLGGAVEVA